MQCLYVGQDEKEPRDPYCGRQALAKTDTKSHSEFHQSGFVQIVLKNKCVIYLFKIQNIYSPTSHLACKSGCDVKDDPLKVFAESLYVAHCKFSLHIAHCSLQIAHFQCALYIVHCTLYIPQEVMFEKVLQGKSNAVLR